MTLKIEEYVRDDGRSPYRDWFDRLGAAHAAKVSVALLRLSQGNTEYKIRRRTRDSANRKHRR